MQNKLTTGVMAVLVAVGLTGGGVALAASTHHAVKACSKKTSHALGSQKHGKCPKGFTKVTLGARGPRGPAGRFVHFDIHGTWANNACHNWMVAIPALQAPHS